MGYKLRLIDPSSEHEYSVNIDESNQEEIEKIWELGGKLVMRYRNAKVLIDFSKIPVVVIEGV